MSIKICSTCKHYQAIALCRHSELADLVTGEPSDCYSNRGMLEKGANISHCGPKGKFHEPT